MEEPSVLDYLKQKLNPRNWGKHLAEFETPEEEHELPAAPEMEVPEAGATAVRRTLDIPWRTLLALLFALFGQRLLEPTSANAAGGVLFYALALAMIFLALLKQEWRGVAFTAENPGLMQRGVRIVALYVLIPVALLAFITLSNNQFTSINVFLWISAIVLAALVFWIPAHQFDLRPVWEKIKNYLKTPYLHLNFNSWALLAMFVFAVGAYFHFSQLSSVPLDMTSDHVEKLLDVNRVLNGQLSIFFPNNGGREAIAFYLTAALIKLFGASLSFTTLKLGMALAFLVSLYFVYRLGEELGNRWTGLLAMLFLGFASWTNIIARVGLRLVLEPVFVAPLLYFLVRGFRRSQRNDFVIAGILLGAGMYGYTAFRIAPLVVFLAVLLYLLHQKDRQKRRDAWAALGIMALISVIVVLPMIRYAIEYPEAFLYRSVTRMTSAEVPLAKDVIQVFLSNTWNAITMPFWNDGSTWFISVTNRPALDVVTAAVYFIGLAALIIRWVKKRRWQDLFLVLSIPVLMLPSILALAFPIENPSLSRAGGAAIPIMVTAAIGFQSVLSNLWQKSRAWLGKSLVVLLAVGLAFLSANQNYDLVFNQYNTAYANATWNTKQIGDVCKDFINSVGSPDTCYVVATAYWVDTRLVAVVAGYPTMDYAIWPKDLSSTVSDTRAKMFIVKADQTDQLSQLKLLYPNGFATLHQSPNPGRDFIAYLVPPSASQ